VVCDFRRADCALGGQGAPLVPHVDALLFSDPHEVRVALNLGGIANVTVLAPGRPLVAWDTGPANMLLDALVRERTGGAERFDRDGARATRGRVDDALVEAMLAHPYFAASPPKSTGREQFGAPFLGTHAARLGALAFDDACATLVDLTARSIAESLGRAAAARPDLTIVGGGGSRNRALLANLERRLGSVTTTEAFGIDPDAKEALAFAVLACETLRGRPAARSSVTGARGDALLGAIVPFELERVSAQFRALDEAKGTG
jgi:anhydro-N-acetylmuramic acid kinase